MGKKLVYGVGLNDADYAVDTRVGVKRSCCPYYRKWKGMLERCSSEKFKNKHDTYKDCYVCEEWLTFSNFKKWMETQDWEDKQLDKDLLVYQNKAYSPETCCFLSKGINVFLTKNDKNRGLYPLGVCYKIKSKKSISERTRPFMSTISISRNRKFLGYFNTPEEAHHAWQKAKIDLAEVLKKEQTDIRIIAGLQRIINKIQNDYDNNLETVDF